MRFHLLSLIICALVLGGRADELGSTNLVDAPAPTNQFENTVNGDATPIDESAFESPQPKPTASPPTTTTTTLMPTPGPTVQFVPYRNEQPYYQARVNRVQAAQQQYNYAQNYYPEPEEGQPQFRAQPANGRHEQHLSNVHDRQPEHRPVITQSYGRPASSASVIWDCNGMRYDNYCHLRNRYNFVKFVYTDRFQADTRLLLLDVAAAARHRHNLPRRPNPVYSYNAARVDTGYLATRYVDACLYLDYAWSGVGEKRLVVVQRNEDDVCVYFDEINQQQTSSYPEPVPKGYDPRFSPPPSRRPDPVLEWKHVEIPLDLRYGSPKFWLEFIFDLGQKEAGEASWRQLGHIALRNFTIANGRCLRPVDPSRQNCDDPLV